MISKGKVVQLKYVLQNAKGAELDRSDDNAAFEYLHGGGQIVPGLEAGIEGLKIGDKKKVVVLAGESLHFDIEVVGVRPATPDELKHGHAHGPDGHHHH